MFLVPLNYDAADVCRHLVEEYLPKSRFYVLDLEDGIFKGASSKLRSVRIVGVRLRRKKFYCGQHAGPCRAVFAKRHPLASYLEGADFVGFNDMLNDLCDKHRIEANIWSTRESLGRLYLRRGRSRCNFYECDYITGQHWHANERESTSFYDTHFGVETPAPRSKYTDGTPGIPAWLKADEAADEYKPLFEHEGKSRRQVREMAGQHDG